MPYNAYLPKLPERRLGVELCGATCAAKYLHTYAYEGRDMRAAHAHLSAQALPVQQQGAFARRDQLPPLGRAVIRVEQERPARGRPRRARRG